MKLFGSHTTFGVPRPLLGIRWTLCTWMFVAVWLRSWKVTAAVSVTFCTAYQQGLVVQEPSPGLACV
jgi:hypothetical protein